MGSRKIREGDVLVGLRAVVLWHRTSFDELPVVGTIQTRQCLDTASSVGWKRLQAPPPDVKKSKMSRDDTAAIR